MGLARRAFCALLLLAVAGCAAESARRVDQLSRDDGKTPRVALMPLDVALSRVNAGGSQSPVAEWTTAAERNLTLALRLVAKRRGLMLRPAAEAVWRSEEFEQTRLLQNAVQTAVRTHQFGSSEDRLPGKEGRLGWTLGQGALALRDRLQADYALFVYLRDSYSSTGRRVLTAAAALLIGYPLSGGEQIGVASLYDLRDGNLVWVRELDRTTGDLRNREDAAETAEALLKDFPG